MTRRVGGATGLVDKHQLFRDRDRVGFPTTPRGVSARPAVNRREALRRRNTLRRGTDIRMRLILVIRLAIGLPSGGTALSASKLIDYSVGHISATRNSHRSFDIESRYDVAAAKILDMLPHPLSEVCASPLRDCFGDFSMRFQEPVSRSWRTAVEALRRGIEQEPEVLPRAPAPDFAWPWRPGCEIRRRA